MRAAALGRKNFLSAGSDAGGERAAAMYSLMATAKLNGLDPEAYLRMLLESIGDHPINQVEDLLPWKISANYMAQDLMVAAIALTISIVAWFGAGMLAVFNLTQSETET